MITSSLIDLNRVGLNYHTFTISLDKCNKSFNALMSYLLKYVFLGKTKWRKC